MSESERGQIVRTAAEVYEEFFVPALLQEWANLVTEAVRIQPSQRVLDVACGTGVLARTLVERVGPNGVVVGVDPNKGMLAVARRKAPAIEWRDGRAEALPFEANSFDAVVSQFGLMFFEDRLLAIQEMMRVLQHSGRLAVAVWDSVENFPGYAELANLLQRLYGDQVVEEFLVPFSLGALELLSTLFTEAGVVMAEVTRQEGTVRFPSLRDWLLLEVKEWLLGDRMDDAQFEGLLTEAKEILRPFVTAEGTVVLRTPGYIITATKP
jgi:ubiquinone/menaquinone biosynthesis C-methylase UbiE